MTASVSPGAAVERQSESIRLENVAKHFAAQEHPALRDLTLEIHDRELLVLLGPSGCGKSTLLNLLAGLDEPTRGNIYFGDREVTRVPAEERNISMVFQNVGLYPHMNALDNIRFPLKRIKTAPDIIRRRVDEMAAMLGISHLLARRLNELSGGERQRVAIAKALVKRPRLFLLDEPFSSLDADRRRQLRSELLRIHRHLQITMVFVTHDQEEAMSLADRIAVMRAGELMQLGAPLDIYQRPAALWVASFIGAYPVNIMQAVPDLAAGKVRLLVGDEPSLDLDPATLARWRAANLPERVTVAVRPEYVRVAPAGAPGISAQISIRELLGDNVLYHLQADQLQMRAVRPVSEMFEVGENLSLTFEWPRVFVFHPETEKALL